MRHKKPVGSFFSALLLLGATMSSASAQSGKWTQAEITKCHAENSARQYGEWVGVMASRITATNGVVPDLEKRKINAQIDYHAAFREYTMNECFRSEEATSGKPQRAHISAPVQPLQYNDPAWNTAGVKPAASPPVTTATTAAAAPAPAVTTLTCQQMSDTLGISNDTYVIYKAGVQAQWMKQGCTTSPTPAATATTAAAAVTTLTCQQMSDTYGITHNRTWGTATVAIQQQWGVARCTTSATPAATGAAPPAATGAAPPAATGPTIKVYYGSTSIPMASIPLVSVSASCYKIRYAGNIMYFAKSAYQYRADFGGTAALDYNARSDTPC